jgi:hypothetical protein
MNIKLIFILVFKYKYYKSNSQKFDILTPLVTGFKTSYGKFSTCGSCVKGTKAERNMFKMQTFY